MVAGMPAMVRTRFSTPTIGREWMIGEEGEAVTNVSPDGVVRVRGALWRARTNRATPIELHDGIRVVEVDGLLLEVEPLEGGAVDYREKRRGGDEDGDDGVADEADDGRVLIDGKPLDPSLTWQFCPGRLDPRARDGSRFVLAKVGGCAGRGPVLRSGFTERGLSGECTTNW